MKANVKHCYLTPKKSIRLFYENTVKCGFYATSMYNRFAKHSGQVCSIKEGESVYVIEKRGESLMFMRLDNENNPIADIIYHDRKRYYNY